MFRGSVVVRDATPDDVPDLVTVWAGSRPGLDRATDLADARASVARIAADPDQRLLIGFVDDEPAGATHLVRGALTPLTTETAIFVSHLQVVDSCRRHGVGRALLDAAVGWAEEKGTGHVLTAAAVTSRDANRFMARLGLAQVAVVRGATVPSLRARLPVEAPVAARVASRSHRSHRSVGQVLVARRSLRRSQAEGS